jgi:hypothetical protein
MHPENRTLFRSFHLGDPSVCRGQGSELHRAGERRNVRRPSHDVGVRSGSKYALVVGDKVYTLDTNDKAALASLDKAAGGQAKVTGTLNGDTIQVASVAAGN